MRSLSGLAVLALASAAITASAQTTAPPVPTVVVKNTRDPVDKSYRKMVKGMERFEREHALAPQATLRFRLLPRLPNADMTGITLRIAGDTASQPIAVAPDNSFALVRNDQLLREDAAVLANRKTASMTWRASIVSPGVPEGKRRWATCAWNARSAWMRAWYRIRRPCSAGCRMR